MPMEEIEEAGGLSTATQLSRKHGKDPRRAYLYIASILVHFLIVTEIILGLLKGQSPGVPLIKSSTG